MNILNCLSNEELKLVSLIDLKKDQMLFLEKEECKYVGIVLEGSISISSYSYLGKELVYYSINDYGVFGNNLIFSSSPFYKGNVIAKRNSKVALISKNNLISLLQSNSLFLENYLAIQADETKLLNERIKLLSFDKADDRLLYYLHKNNNKIVYSSITNLADLLGLRRETLSRLISKLVDEKIIKINNKTICLTK